MNDTTNEEKLLRYAKLQTIAVFAILILLLVAVIFISVECSTMQRCLDMIEADLRMLDMTTLNQAIGSLEDVAKSFAGIDIDSLNETVAAFKEAADGLAGVDIDALNRAVTALEGAAKNLGEVDMKALNSLVGALEDVASRLQTTVSTITGIFGR